MKWKVVNKNASLLAITTFPDSAAHLRENSRLGQHVTTFISPPTNVHRFLHAICLVITLAAELHETHTRVYISISLARIKKTLIHHRRETMHSLITIIILHTPRSYFSYLFSTQCNYINIIVNLTCTAADFLYSRAQDHISGAY